MLFRSDQRSFNAIDLCVRRNGYGRQVDSFEADLAVAGLDEAFRAVFIRAPKVESHGSTVEVLATCDENPVLVRGGAFGNILCASFHPELTSDVRIHQLFLSLAFPNPSPSASSTPLSHPSSNTEEIRHVRP